MCLGTAAVHFSLLSEKWGAVPEGWRRAVRNFPLSVPSLVEKQHCSALSRDLGASKEVKCNKENRLNKTLCWPPRNLLCHCSPEGSAESLCGEQRQHMALGGCTSTVPTRHSSSRTELENPAQLLPSQTSCNLDVSRQLLHRSAWVPNLQDSCLAGRSARRGGSCSG